MIHWAGPRWPMILDPDGFGAQWVRDNFDADPPLVSIALERGVLREADLPSLILAVETGAPLLLHLDGVDPILYELLMRKTISTNDGNALIPIGDRNIELDSNFRIFIVSESTKINLPQHVELHLRPVLFKPKD